MYILVLPAMGIVSEILPTFSRKPIFGYSFLVFAGAAIGFIGFGVWAHHMFSSAIGPVARASFGLATMFIAVPTGIKIFNWVFTMIGGKLKFTTPMLFAVGFITMFTIGGLSGVTHAIVPHDYQQTDTYWVVAHFHYVLFGGALFGLVGGIYYWFPKVTGKLMSERLGKLHFWTWFIGFNLTFGPMHMSGLLGQPRRTAVLPEGLGGTVELYNLLSTVGALVLVVSALIFLFNLITSIRSGEEVGARPVGRAHPGVDDGLAARRAQLRRDPRRGAPRRVLVPQVRRGRGRRAAPDPGRRQRGPHRCRRRRCTRW